MSTFNETPVAMDHYKADTTFGDVRGITDAAIQAAERDPSGTELAMSILVQGAGPAVVVLIADLAKTVNGLLDRLEATAEESAA